MTFYSLVLFVHVAATLALFAAIIIEALALYRLRRVSTLNEVRLWIDPAPGLAFVTTGSLLGVFFSGIYLAIRVSAVNAAWPRVTIIAMFLLAPFAATVARRMREIRRASATATTIDADLQRRLQDPFLKVATAIRVAIVLGIVLLMAAKPALGTSVAVLAASIAVALISLVLTSRRTASFARS